MQSSSLKFSNLKVGLTVFIGLTIFFIFIFLVGTEGNYFSSTYNLKIFVENTEGLAEGSMVTLGGLKIGSVSDLEFTHRNGNNGIKITLSIKSNYKSQITNSSDATIKTIGLLGDRFVDISIGQPGEASLASGEFLPVKPTFSLDKLSAKIQPALDDFSQLLANLRAISDTISSGKGTLGKLVHNTSTIDEFESVLHGLGRFITAVNKQQGSLGKFTYDTSLYNSLNTLSDNLNAVTDSLRSGKGSLGKLLTQDSVYYAVSSISNRLNNIIAKAEGDSTLVGGLFNNKKIYNDFNLLVDELNQLINGIKTQPEKYLHISVF
jgi:phospholipid/cholesterol/gamma-HCH transport system substrate-binding protein